MHKFLAKDQSNCPQSLFNWAEKDTPFWNELKTEMRTYFAAGGGDGVSYTALTPAQVADAPTLGHKEPIGAWLRHALFVALTVYAMVLWYQGAWASLMLLPWAYWLGGSHLMHTGSHWALSTSPLVNVVGAYFGSAHVSIHDWMHQHVIGHHAHTNIVGKDPDLEHFAHVDSDGPGFRLSIDQVWLPKYLNYRMAMPMQAFFTTLGPSVTNQTKYWTRRAFFSVPFLRTTRTRVALHVAGRLLLVGVMGVSPFFRFSIGKALVFAILPLGFHGYIYYVFSQISHATVSCAQDKHGDEAACIKREWAEHQVRHGSDYETDSYFWLVASIGLNAQVVHHLFPQVSTAHYPAMSRILARVAAKHGVPYVRKPSFWAAVAGHVQYVSTLNSAPPADTDPEVLQAVKDATKVPDSATKAALKRLAYLVLYTTPMLVLTPVTLPALGLDFLRAAGFVGGSGGGGASESRRVARLAGRGLAARAAAVGVKAQ